MYIHIYIYINKQIIKQITYIYIYIYIIFTVCSGGFDSWTFIWGELRGSRGMGVVSNSRFGRVLLLILYMLKPSCRPMFKPPSLGPLSSP